MKIAIIGTGYVGLVTGACLAELGNQVICSDINKKKIEDLNKGIIPIYEPDLAEIVKENLEKGTLSFSNNNKKTMAFAEIVFCAVGTPPEKDFNSDITTVTAIAKEFGQVTDSYKIFVNKSTVPIKTGELCKKIIAEEIKRRNKKIPFDVVSNPEFLREGSAVEDTLNPDRIIIGYENKRSRTMMKILFSPFSDQKIPILFTDIKTAELIKYASNAFLATKISFINEIANFCELAGGNIEDIAKGMGLDNRIGEKFLHAGIGYGGSCFPKDVKALIQSGKKHGYDFEIIKAADKVNEAQKETLYYKLRNILGPLENKKIAIWGLAFKPETDDMREAPSLTIIKKLQTDGAIISAYDPVAIKTAQKVIEPINITFHQSPLEAAENADALLIVTEWEEFKNMNFDKLKTSMRTPLILDGRNLLNRKNLEKQGFKYVNIGSGENCDPKRSQSELPRDFGGAKEKKRRNFAKQKLQAFSAIPH